jgi:hypothetical protein
MMMKARTSSTRRIKETTERSPIRPLAVSLLMTRVETFRVIRVISQYAPTAKKTHKTRR